MNLLVFLLIYMLLVLRSKIRKILKVQRIYIITRNPDPLFTACMSISLLVSLSLYLLLLLVDTILVHVLDYHSCTIIKGDLGPGFNRRVPFNSISLRHSQQNVFENFQGHVVDMLKFGITDSFFIYL